MSIETAPYTFHTTLFHPKALFGSTGRVWQSLDKLAAHFVNNGYMSESRAPSVKAIAHALNMDRSHVFRLLKERPGFVKVITIDGTERTIGWYYEKRFYDNAAEKNNYYPKDTTRLGAHRVWPAEVVVTIQVDEEPEPEIEQPVDILMYTRVVSTSPAPKYEPLLVETVVVDEARLAGAIDNLGMITDNTKDDFMEVFAAIRNGSKVDLSKLESNLVVLASLYQLLRKPHEPEDALLLHDILSSL